MPGTFAFDVKDALVTALRADATLAGIITHPEIGGVVDEDISYGYGPWGPNGRPRLMIWVGEIEWDDEASVGLGMSRRDEMFRIMVTTESWVPGDTQIQANNRVQSMMKAIEALVRNPRWSGLGIVHSELKPLMLGETLSDQGRAAVLIMSLHVRARKS